MTHEEFRAACSIMFGDFHHGGVQEAAAWLNVHPRNVKRWMSGEKPIGPGLANTVLRELSLRLRQDDTAATRVIRQALLGEPRAA